MLRSRPRLRAAEAAPGLAAPAAGLLRKLVSGELVVVLGVVFVAAVLTSIAPPPPAFALQNHALARVGPGTVADTVTRAGYRLELLVAPNRAAAPDSFSLRITRNGRALRGADVTLTFDMTTMQMPQQEYQLAEIRPGVYSRAAPALVMVGVWGLMFQIAPRNGPPFNALILDQADG
jgi:copper transport protein